MCSSISPDITTTSEAIIRPLRSNPNELAAVCHRQAPLLKETEMICVLEVLAVLGLVATGVAIMVGALPLGDAIRRVGSVVVLLIIMPMFITAFIQTMIAPMLTALRSAAQDVAYALVVIGTLTLLRWLASHRLQRRSGKNHTKTEEE